jgi:hypothetical protein
MDRELSPMLRVGVEGEGVGMVLDHDLGSPPRSIPDLAWRWTLRLALPTLVFLSGLALYWIWVDRVFGTTSWDTFMVGLPLAVEATAAAIWSIGVWCAKDLV